MTLNAPKQIIFIVALVIAVLAVLGALVAIPFVTTYAFWLLVLAFVILTGGVLMKNA
jgi:hypothetical protein